MNRVQFFQSTGIALQSLYHPASMQDTYPKVSNNPTSFTSHTLILTPNKTHANTSGNFQRAPQSSPSNTPRESSTSH